VDLERVQQSAGSLLKVDAGEELISAVKVVLTDHTYLAQRVLKEWSQ